MIQIKNLSKQINTRLNRTLLVGLFGGFMLMFFGGLGYFTNNKFGADMFINYSLREYQSYLDIINFNLQNWYQIMMVTIGSTWMLLIVVWWTWTSFFRREVPIQKETRAISLASLGLASATIVPGLIQAGVTLWYTNETFVDVFLGEKNISFENYLLIYYSISFLLILLSIGVGIYWAWYKEDNALSREYHWVRNALFSIFVSSFFIYNLMFFGAGITGIDISKLMKHLNITEDTISTTWDNLKFSEKLAISIILNAFFQTLDFGPRMNGEAFANALLEPGRFELLIHQKNWFYSVNNNWHGMSALIVLFVALTLPWLSIWRINNKGEYKVHNGKETVLRTINYVFSLMTILYIINSYIILYVAPGWNPSINNDIFILVKIYYYGTIYYWIMFWILAFGTIGIISFPLLKYRNFQKNKK